MFKITLDLNYVMCRNKVHVSQTNIYSLVYEKALVQSGQKTKLTKPGMNNSLPKVYLMTPYIPTSASNQPQWRSFSHFYLGPINGGC